MKLAAKARPARAPVPAIDEIAWIVDIVRARLALRLAWARTRARLQGEATTAESWAQWLADDDDAAERESWRREQPLALQVERLERERARAEPGRLTMLARLFGLDAFEQAVLEVVTAFSFDTRLAAAWTALEDAQPGATEAGVRALYGFERESALDPERGLLRWELVARERRSGGHDVLWLDPQLRDWLAGRHRLADALIGCARLVDPPAPLDSWPVSATARQAKALMESGPGTALPGVRVVVHGAPGAGRRSFAACVASQLQLPLLAIDAEAVPAGDWPLVFARAQRQAFLDRCALAWLGIDSLPRPWPSATGQFPLQFVIAGDDGPPVADATAAGIAVRLEPPGAEERAALWRHHLPSVSAWPRGALASLASGHAALPADIVRAARLSPTDAKDASRVLKDIVHADLGGLAVRVECPYRWDDLVVSAHVKKSLHDFAFEARAREAFWRLPQARRLFPHGRGLSALLSGPSGTGKTMAAQVVAAELGLELFRVDYPSLVSKWVGETMRNTERLFSLARRHPIVLFIDECDAMFGRRVEETETAQDLHANADLGALLLAVENYPGIVLLATNMKRSMDRGFVRRIRYAVDFAKPDEAERAEIWRRLVGELVGAKEAGRLAGPLDRLATIAATGAQIKGAVLAAIFSAQRAGEGVALADLVHGLAREFAKEGYSLSTREIEELGRVH